MALINCPECGKEISDKCEVCIHCGFPIKKNTKCIINGTEYDLSFILDDSYSILYKVRDLVQISHCSITDAKPIVEKIIETNEIPKTLYLKPQEIKEQTTQNVPRCPTCNSTKIKKISGLSKAGSFAMWGIFSRKVHKQWHCNNCGSEW